MIQVALNAMLESRSYKIALDDIKHVLSISLANQTMVLMHCAHMGGIPVLGFAEKTSSKWRKPLYKCRKK